MNIHVQYMSKTWVEGFRKLLFREIHMKFKGHHLCSVSRIMIDGTTIETGTSTTILGVMNFMALHMWARRLPKLVICADECINQECKTPDPSKCELIFLYLQFKIPVVHTFFSNITSSCRLINHSAATGKLFILGIVHLQCWCRWITHRSAQLREMHNFVLE